MRPREPIGHDDYTIRPSHFCPPREFRDQPALVTVLMLAAFLAGFGVGWWVG